MNLISSVIRTQATGIILFRVRSAFEYDAIMHMFSALLTPDEFKAWYKAATKEPYSFGYINAAAKHLDDIFHIRFEHKVSWGSSDEEQE